MTGMRITLYIQYETDFFQLEEFAQAHALAERTDAEIYSWKTSGIENWLVRGPSVVDLLGLVLLPRGLPDNIDMPDDIEEDDDMYQ